jgi:DNA-binding NtrC family response regulator
VPVGADQLGWVCAFHRASPRRTGPLVIVDGTASTAHPAELWSDPFDAPSARADGGTLVVLNVAGLPQAAQDALAVALSRRASGGLSLGLVATLPEPPERLLEERLLSRALAQFLLPNVLRLPRLVERPEDLRALIMDRLCRSGVRFGGAPLGIEPQALSRLVDYTWPGNEAELRSVVERAAHAATGERVSVADLRTIGFEVALSETQPPGSTLP